jgi:hypothetical protein
MDSTPLILRNFSHDIISLYYSIYKSSLLTVDQNGGISIWKVNSGNNPPIVLEKSFSISKRVKSASFCSQRAHVILGTEEKKAEIYTPDGVRLFQSEELEKDSLQIFYPHVGHLIVLLEDGDIVFWQDYHPHPQNLFQVKVRTYVADTFSQGEDQMNHGSDLKAFSELIASCNLKPPLSIGIFANWGAGKSFFMRKLREKVDSLSRWARVDMKYVQQKDLPYFKNIIQVEFNAWHYVESDLWAALVEEIFSNLKLPGEKKDDALDRRNKLLEVLESERKGLLGLMQKRKEIEDKQRNLQTFISMKIMNKFISSKSEFPEIDKIFSDLEKNLFEKIQRKDSLSFQESLEKVIRAIQLISQDIDVSYITRLVKELQDIGESSADATFHQLGKIKNAISHKLFYKDIPSAWRDKKYTEELASLEKILNILLYEINSQKLEILGINNCLKESEKILQDKKKTNEEKYKSILEIVKNIPSIAIQKSFPHWFLFSSEMEDTIRSRDKKDFIAYLSSLNEILLEDEIALPQDLQNQYHPLFDFEHPIYKTEEWQELGRLYIQAIRDYIQGFLFLSFGIKGLIDLLLFQISKREDEILDLESFVRETFILKQEENSINFFQWLKSNFTAFLQHCKQYPKSYSILLASLISSIPLYYFSPDGFTKDTIRSVLDSFVDSIFLQISGVLAIVSPFLKYLYLRWRILSPSIKKFWNIMVEVMKESKDELDKMEKMFQEEKKDLTIAEEKVHKRILELQKEMEDLKSAGEDMLSHFIQERTEDRTYKDKLGLMAKIRQDFERLSKYMDDYNEAQFIETRLDLENLQSKSKINRIVLYIDDLDRCPPERVVKVLQAVHLLLSFELFVVVVAVDSRWVIQCLRLGYKDLFIGSSIDLDGDGSVDITRATPHDYLEKIFQIPYWLNPIDDDSKQKLLSALVQETDFDSIVNNKNYSQPSEEIVLLNEADELAQELQISSKIRKQLRSKYSISDRLDLSHREILFLKKLSSILGNSPRAIKRYVNIFRLLRVSLEEEKWNVYYHSSPSPDRRNIWNLENYKIVMFLQAMITGLPTLSPFFFQELRDSDISKKNLQQLLEIIRKKIKKQKIDSEEEIENRTEITSPIHKKKMEKELGDLERWMQDRKIKDKESWDELYINQIKFWDFAVSRYSFRIDPFR